MIALDPTEAILAVIGVKPILSKEVERVTMAQLHEAEDLGKRIYREAKSIINGETFDVPTVAINYKKMLHDLTEEFNEGQLQAMVAAFPAQLDSIAASFIVDAKKVVDYLKSMFPIRNKQTLLGPENILPSELSIRRFATAFDVLDNPMRTLMHIANGSLLKSQAKAVQQIYPSISEAISDALMDAGTDAKAAKKSYEVPARVSIGWSAWRNIPRISPQLQQRLQTNFVKAQQEQPKPQSQASGGQASVAAKEAMTATQRSLYSEATKG